MDFVLTGMNKQMHTGMILVDFRKAFKILDQGVILEKMKCFGFQTSAIKCFEVYFSNRKYLICMRLEHSNPVYHKALFLDHSFFYYMRITLAFFTHMRMSKKLKMF